MFIVLTTKRSSSGRSGIAVCIKQSLRPVLVISLLQATRTLSEALIDMTLADSFPASDPPSWTLGRDVQPGLSSDVGTPIEAPNNEPVTPINSAVERRGSNGARSCRRVE